MSVRIVRMRNGEDVIADLYEVTTKEEPEKPIAFQLRNPYNVYVMEQDLEDNDIQKVSDPEISFRPWAPLSLKDTIMLKLDEVVTAYETYEEIIKKYTELVEATNGRGNGDGADTAGSTVGTSGGFDAPATDQSDTVEATT